ncbi:transglycosylase domain-containing protein [Dolosicoccus paucivorans]
MGTTSQTTKEKLHHIWQGVKNLWRYYRGWKWLIFLGMLSALIVSSYLVFIAKTTSVDTLQDALKTTTALYDENDEFVTDVSSQKGTYIDLDQISPVVQEVVIATEDKRFYEHNGFDTMGIGRAFVRLLLNRDTSGGGGSTLTQQLAKNAFLTQDQTFQRKFKELFLALEIEKQYSKDQILEMYLNHAYFGNGVWGVEDASMRYFGHSASTLTWNESIVLTGILKGPSIFNPIDDYEAAIERRNVIVDLLDKQKVLSDDEAMAIKHSEIYLEDAYYSDHQTIYLSYLDGVLDEASRKTDIPEEDLLSKGYRIYTHLNTGYQDSLDAAYAQDWLFPSDEDPEEPLVQSASVVVDPTTGGVAAIYGGRGEYVFRGFNRGTDMRRAPGSTIKPLAVYVPALEEGYKIHDMVEDVVKPYGSDKYAPNNYDLQTDPSGEVPLYYALAQSKNTSAVYLMDKFGISRSVQKLKQFGLNIPQEDQSLTLALGALSQGVSPLQLANAYSVFPNHGIRYDSTFIRRIEDSTGKVIYENKRPTKHMVMTPNVAADMTSMMLDTYGGYGTGYDAGPDYGQIAGKTGSTEVADGNLATRDKWMVGYTPDFVIASWVGFDEVGSEDLDELMPSMGQLFNLQTTQLMAHSPQTPFEVPMASQMTEDTNDVDDSILSSDLKEQFDDWLNDVGPWLEDRFYEGKEWLQKATDQVKDWLPN